MLDGKGEGLVAAVVQSRKVESARQAQAYLLRTLRLRDEVAIIICCGFVDDR